jgi:hypothetical protein
MDALGVGYAAGAAGGESMGQGLNRFADAISQAQNQKRELHQRIMGSMLGKFIDAGYLKPSKEMLAELTKEFKLKGIDLSNPQTLSDVIKSSGMQFSIKGVKTDPTTNQVTDIEWATPDEVAKQKADLESKQEEAIYKKKELEIKQQESEQKSQEIKAASVKQATSNLPWFGLVDSPQKREAMQIQDSFRKQLLAKSGLNPKPQYDPKTQKLQHNSKTGEYRVVAR